MKRMFTATLAIVLGMGAASALADQKLEVSLGEYKKRRAASISREAFQRADARLAGVQVGMRSDQFFEQMEMMMVRDKAGKPMDGFVEGYLHEESRRMNESHQGPERYLVFGYYEDWKSQKGAVKKFYVVFRDQTLTEVSTFGRLIAARGD